MIFHFVCKDIFCSVFGVPFIVTGVLWLGKGTGTLLSLLLTFTFDPFPVIHSFLHFLLRLVVGVR